MERRSSDVEFPLALAPTTDTNDSADFTCCCDLCLGLEFFPGISVKPVESSLISGSILSGLRAAFEVDELFRIIA